jgi:hypothetical protein
METFSWEASCLFGSVPIGSIAVLIGIVLSTRRSESLEQENNKVTNKKKVHIVMGNKVRFFIKKLQIKKKSMGMILSKLPKN